MDRKDFDRLLSQGKIPSVLLFEGEEEHMKQSALDALQKKLLPEGLEELNRTLLDAPETDQIIAAAETLPFRADRRFVVVRNDKFYFGFIGGRQVAILSAFFRLQVNTLN